MQHRLYIHVPSSDHMDSSYCAAVIQKQTSFAFTKRTESETVVTKNYIDALDVFACSFEQTMALPRKTDKTRTCGNRMFHNEFLN